MNRKNFYMQSAIDLAAKGKYTAPPNPNVGCVIVENSKIISKAYHQRAGKEHAEILALKNLKKKVNDKMIMYINLEPCCHYGKTPPCTNEITKNKIPKVVIGIEDPYPKVSGAGIKKLKDAGVQVDVGVLKKECEEHHKRFLTYINKNRPYIILKWAETNDGFIAPKTKKEIKPVWISNKYSRS